VIVKRGELDPNEVAALRRFCEARSFDLDYALALRPCDMVGVHIQARVAPDFMT